MSFCVDNIKKLLMAPFRLEKFESKKVVHCLSIKQKTSFEPTQPNSMFLLFHPEQRQQMFAGTALLCII
jgi:hypothetical protein